MCDVFHEPLKWITNHDTPFTGAQTERNGGPRGGNDGNSGNGGACGRNERYEKKTKTKILDEQVVVAVETNTVHKEGVPDGNANATEGTTQAGTWGE